MPPLNVLYIKGLKTFMILQSNAKPQYGQEYTHILKLHFIYKAVLFVDLHTLPDQPS